MSPSFDIYYTCYPIPIATHPGRLLAIVLRYGFGLCDGLSEAI
jgi:hypothetical protein